MQLTATTGTWLRRPGQATSWAQDMLCPGIAVVIAIAHPSNDGRGSGTCPDTADLAVLDTTSDVIAHGHAADSGRIIRSVIEATTGRLLLAYDAAGVRSRLLAEAGRRGIDPLHLEDPDRWRCVMQARSAALGNPDHLYPLGVTPHNAAAAAAKVLDLIVDIAQQRCVLPPVPPRADRWPA